MFTLLLLFLFLGIMGGLLLTYLIIFHLVKVNCPKCKKPKPLKEIILFQWKSRQITGQTCQKCRQIKPQVKIF